MKHVFFLLLVLGIALSAIANWVSPPAPAGDGGTAETWSRYPAMTNVNMANNSLSNFQSIVTANAGARFGLGTTNPLVMFHVNGQARAWSFSASQQGGPTSPTFRFESEPQSGFYKTTNVGELAFATMGLDRFFIGQGTVSLASNVHFDGRGNSITNVGTVSVSNLSVRGSLSAEIGTNVLSVSNRISLNGRTIAVEPEWISRFDTTYMAAGGGTNMTLFHLPIGSIPYRMPAWQALVFGGSLSTNLPSPETVSLIPPSPDPSLTNIVIQYAQYTPNSWGSSPYVWDLRGVRCDPATMTFTTNVLFTVTNLATDCQPLFATHGTGITHSITSSVFNTFVAYLSTPSGTFSNRPAGGPAERFGILMRFKWVK